MIGTRGLTMSKVAHVRQAMQQICSDERNPLSMTARIMAEHDITARDVMDVCDVATDAVADMRNREMWAMRA